MARPPLRIPLFDDYFLFNEYEEIKVARDRPLDAWLSHAWRPERDTGYPATNQDPVASREAARLFKFRTCPFCRAPMRRVLEEEQWSGEVLLCDGCNYWGGEGVREWGHGGTPRAVLGRYCFIANPFQVPISILLDHLRRYPRDLLALTPREAEIVLASILREVLDCEVRLAGGVKDEGIDALIIRSDNVRTIVQIKWRESSRKAESVSVVREVAGTLLARGIPNGMLITTCCYFSKQARHEARLVSSRTVNKVGTLHLELKSFNDIVDMLHIPTRLTGSPPDPKVVIPGYSDDECMFDNGGLGMPKHRRPEFAATRGKPPAA